MILTRLNTLYCGISTDVARRFQEHCQGAPKGAKSLRGKSPLTLMYSQEIGNRSLASQVEARVKKLTRAQKEQLISGQTSPHILWPQLFIVEKAPLEN